MNDLKQKILDKMKDPTLAAFATVTEDNRPWVRYVVAWADDQLSIWFATFKTSRKVKQIQANPHVHLALGVTDLAMAASWIQVQGQADILEDADTKKRIWYDMLEAIFNGPEDPNYVVCRIKPYRIEYYTMNRKNPEVLDI
jgi:general stress protein 26